MSNKLRNAYSTLQTTKKDQDYLIPAILGFLLNGREVVDVPNRPGFVYARVRSNLNEVVQVFNDKVSPVYNLPVLLIRDPNNNTRYKVDGRDAGRYQNWGTSSSYLPKHGGQHSFAPSQGLGGDPVWVYSPQIVPWNVAPSGTYGADTVYIHGHPVYRDDVWTYWGATGTPSFSSYLPTGTFARMVLVGFDGNGNPGLSAGDYFSVMITGSASILGYVPAPPTTDFTSLAAVYLLSGTTNIGWNSIYDLRPFFDGQGGGSSSLASGTFDHLIRMWDSSASTTLFYPASDGGLDAAMAQMATGDTLWLPQKQFTGNYTLPNNTTLVGVTMFGKGSGIERGSCELSARVTGTAVLTFGNDSTVQDLSIYAYSDNASLDAIGIDASSGYGQCINVKVYARHTNPAGTAYAILSASAVTLFGGEYRALKELAHAYPFDSVPEGSYLAKDDRSSNDTLNATRIRVGSDEDFVEINEYGELRFIGYSAIGLPVLDGTGIITSATPSSAEISDVISDPSFVVTGYTAMINVSGTHQFLVGSDGTDWWYLSMSKAS